MFLILSLRQARHRLQAAPGADWRQPAFLQVAADLLRPVVPALRQYHQASRRKLCPLSALYPHSQRNHHPETAADPLFAFHRDLAAHAVHQILHNGHPQARALNLAGGGTLDPLKGKEYLLQEFPAHADAVVLTEEIQPYQILFLSRGLGQTLADPHRDLPAFLGVLHRVPYDVDHNLAQAQGIPDQALLVNLPDVYPQALSPLHRLGAHNHGDTVNQVRQGENLLIQSQPPAVDAGHVQHLVHQAHQMRGSRLNLQQAILHPGFLVDMGQSYGCHAYDRVHRRSDVVGHIGQEAALGPVRLLRGAQGLLQSRVPLFQLVDALPTTGAPVQYP